MSSFDELNTLEEQLSDYFDKLSANMANPSNPLPSFEDYIASLTYDTLLTEAQSGAILGSNYSTGASVDLCHLIAAIQREFRMRSRSKFLYFADAEDDSNRVIEYIDTLHGKYTNYLRGTAPEQGKE